MGGDGTGLAGGTQGKGTEMGVRVDMEVGRGGENPASSVPKGTGSFPIFPFADQGDHLQHLALGGTDRRVEQRDRVEGCDRAGLEPQTCRGLEGASVSPVGMLDVRKVKEVREGMAALAAGRRWGRHGVGPGAGTGSCGASRAHMRTHLPLMPSVLFCLLECLPSMLRLMLRRVSSVSSS